eukprot:59941-Alexandrium_andersonii.AAC.1
MRNVLIQSRSDGRELDYTNAGACVPVVSPFVWQGYPSLDKGEVDRELLRASVSGRSRLLIAPLRYESDEGRNQ